MAIENILVVDDEMLMRNFLAETLKRNRYDVEIAGSGGEALKILKHKTFDLVLTDLKMPDISGMDVLKTVKFISPETIVIIMTAYGSIENAVEAMHLGAFNYIIKPFSPETIEGLIKRAREQQSLEGENSYLREQIHFKTKTPHGLIANSPVMKETVEQACRAAASNASVMITGESGTGKEVIASLIHFSSKRSTLHFIKVNCSAIPETLIEAEFFGHEKGAFTGAHQRRQGRFELADTGTLLLDEVTEVPIGLQAKLLRALQEKEFERIGGSRPIAVDVRVVATSNRDLQKAIGEKILREDLYFRLNVVPLHLPPLRERPEDIVPLAENFVQKVCTESHFALKELTKSSVDKLLSYKWPGNVRELSNIIERAVVMNPKEKIEADDLYIDKWQPSSQTSTRSLSQLAGIPLKEVEKKAILATLEENNFCRKKTANLLGITSRTLRNKLAEYESEGTNIH